MTGPLRCQRGPRAGCAFLHELAPTSAAIYAEIEAKVGQDKIEVLLDQIEDLLSALESH